jgi:hypothetical protein
MRHKPAYAQVDVCDTVTTDFGFDNAVFEQFDNIVFAAAIRFGLLQSILSLVGFNLQRPQTVAWRDTHH